MLPSTQLIEAYEAAARLLSFEAAAYELNITPSAISHRIARLEEICGVRLFHRTVRQVQLTAEGARLIKNARTALNALAVFTDNLTPAPVRISTTPMFGINTILPRLERFYEKHPGIRIQLEMDIAAKSSDNLDAVIRYGKLAQRNWTSQAILPVHLIPVHGRRVNFAENNYFPLITYTYSKSTWRGVVPKGIPIENNSMVVPGMTEAIAAAKAGRGVALVAEQFIREELENGTLVRLPYWKTKRSTFYFCRQKSSGSNAVLTFGDWLRGDLEKNSP